MKEEDSAPSKEGRTQKEIVYLQELSYFLQFHDGLIGKNVYFDKTSFGYLRHVLVDVCQLITYGTESSPKYEVNSIIPILNLMYTLKFGSSMLPPDISKLQLEIKSRVNEIIGNSPIGTTALFALSKAIEALLFESSREAIEKELIKELILVMGNCNTIDELNRIKISRKR